MVEILFDFDEEPEEDLEEDPEEESAEDVTPVLSSDASVSDGPGEGGQQNWLLDSDSESSH